MSHLSNGWDWIDSHGRQVMAALILGNLACLALAVYNVLTTDNIWLSAWNLSNVWLNGTIVACCGRAWLDGVYDNPQSD